MDFYVNWKFWLFAVSICQMGLMTYGFVVIKYNDFKHLSKDVIEIKDSIESLNKKVIDIDKNQAVHEEKIKTLENSTR